MKRTPIHHLTFGVLGIVLLALVGCTTPPEPTKSSILANQHFQGGDYQAAIPLYTKAIAEEGPRYDFYYNRGESYRELGRYEEATADYAQALRVQPNDSGRSSYWLAKLYLDAGQTEKALEYAEKTLSFNPDNGRALAIKGIAQYKLGQYELAIETMGLAANDPSVPLPMQLELAKYHALSLFEMGVKQYTAAQKVYMEQYYNRKEALGLRLEDEDHYQAAKFAHINLQDEKREMYLKRCSKAFLKDKNVPK